MNQAIPDNPAGKLVPATNLKHCRCQKNCQQVTEWVVRATAAR